MLPGTYEVRSLDDATTVTVELEGQPGGRLVREAIVVFVARYWAEHGWSPTMREVAMAVGLRQANTVLRHLHLLAAAGRVRFEPNTPRSLRLVRQ